MSNVESNTWKARVLAAMAFEREERDRRWRDCSVRAAAAHDAVVALLDEAVAHWDAAPADPQPAMPEVLADIRKSVMEFVGVNRGKVTYWRAGPDRVIANFNAAIDRAAAKARLLAKAEAEDGCPIGVGGLMTRDDDTHNATVQPEPAVDRSELRERIVDLLCEWVKDVPSKSDLTSSGDIADRILALPGIVPPAAAQDARLRRAALAVLAKWQEKGPFSPIGEMSALALALGHEQPAHERDDAAWAREAAPAPAAPAPYEINFDEVICPGCTHQFRAIPVNVQKELREAKAQGAEKLRRLREWTEATHCRLPVIIKFEVRDEIDRLLAEGKAETPTETRTCGQCRNWSPR
jgi:hypothetical protein